MKPLLALVGPTASGKSRMAVEVAMALAENEIVVEIVSCDSMAVYRGLDIVADKPSPEARRLVPHHLLDVAFPSDAFTAVRYRDLARAAIAGVHAAGHVPMVVGGSGLYFRAVVDDLEFAPTDPDVRARLEGEDPSSLWARVVAADPASAERIGRTNARRIVRAAEILELTGRPPSEFRRSWDSYESVFDLGAVALTWPRDTLLERAAVRARRQLDAGMIEEVRRVRHGGLSRTAGQALGVKEIIDHIDGTCTLDEAMGRLRSNTKRFVRRQLQWFRADPRLRWVDAGEEGWDGAAAATVAFFRQKLA